MRALGCFPISKEIQIQQIKVGSIHDQWRIVKKPQTRTVLKPGKREMTNQSKLN